MHHLDAMRGVAALAVCVQHFADFWMHAAGHAYSPLLSALFLEGMNLGRFGVVLFFLLSGYLIPISLNEHSGVRTFFIRRLTRLYPAFWVSALVAVAANFLYYDTTIALPRFLANLTMVPKFFGQEPVLGMYWTLMMEVIFYLCCAALFVVHPRALHLKWLSFAVVMGASAATALPILANHLIGTKLPVQFLSMHLASLFLGNLIRACGLSDVGSKPLAHPFVLAACAWMIGVIALASGQVWPLASALNPSGGAGMVMADAVAMALFVLVLRHRSLNWRWLVTCGEWSYSIYLLHWPAIILVMVLLPALTFWPHALLALALTILMARWTYLHVEVPGIQLGRRWSGARAVQVLT
jgi:peptidoglycan/LPS O-acetylase OafA/YrhL